MTEPLKSAAPVSQSGVPDAYSVNPGASTDPALCADPPPKYQAGVRTPILGPQSLILTFADRTYIKNQTSPKNLPKTQNSDSLAPKARLWDHFGSLLLIIFDTQYAARSIIRNSNFASQCLQFCHQQSFSKSCFCQDALHDFNFALLC